MPNLGKLAGSEGGTESRRLAAFWKQQLKEIGDTVAYKNWHKRAEKVEERYRDERNRTQELHTRRYNALWGNIQILQPALYGKCPVPICERRFRDKDTVGRGAATILERGLRNEIEINKFHESVSRAVLDYLLSGRGVVWVRYEPIISRGPSLELAPETDMADEKGDIRSGTDQGEKEEGEKRAGMGEGDDDEEKERDDEEAAETPEEQAQEDEEGEDDEEHAEKLEETGSRILRESAPVDYIPWKDFFTLPARARVWDEVTAEAKRVYMSRDQAKRRFGKEIGKALPFQRDDRATVTKTEIASDQPGPESDKVEVFEIWSKQDTKVYWVAEGYDYLCDCIDDPLGLDGFFPTPRPLIANPTNGTMVPVPDYIQYQDQAIQIDELTQRISMLVKACKVAGVYNAAAKDVQRLFDEGTENQLIPVNDWAAFAEKGGVEGNISFIPVQIIKDVINELMQIKQVQIEEMDRLTGINDVLRGTTDARETLGAQRLKTNNTGTRLSARQDEVARFCRDTIRLMADVMCKHFSPQSLIEVGGALYNEGLAPSDMPPLTQLLSMVTTGLGMPGGVPGVSSPTSMPMLPPPGGAGPGAGPPPGAALPPGAQAAPGMPPGMPGMTPPPGVPQLPGVQQPQIPPEVKAKLVAVQRIIQAIALLRDEKLLGFRVDIEVDSTIYGDSEQEKADRTEFLRATTDYLQQAMLMAQQMPEMSPLLGKFLQFGVRGFKIGRDLESAIEEVVEELPALIQKRAQMSMQNPPPELIKAQAQMMKAQTHEKDVSGKHDIAVMTAQADIAAGQQKMQQDQTKGQAELANAAIKNQGEQQKGQMDLLKTHADMQAGQQQAAVDMEEAKLDREIKHLEAQVKIAELKAKLREYAHEQTMGHQELAMQPHQTAQTQAQVGIEAQRARQSEAQAQSTQHQAPVEQERTKQAAINAEAAKYRAQHPAPKSDNSSGGDRARSHE